MSKPETNWQLREALRTVLKNASAEEGQMWLIRLMINEDLYGKWEALCETNQPIDSHT